MLFEPNRTAYDLNFRFVGVDVRVHPFFWLLSIYLGWSITDVEEYRVLLLAVWVACMFGSILIHELGHVLVGRVFGSHGHIVLYSVGGLAIGSNDLRRRWQRIAVLLAGPVSQLVLLGLVVLFEWNGGVEWVRPGTARVVVGEVCLYLFYINLVWPILNLLPIWPLDGGQIARELCTLVSKRRGVRFSLGLSFAVAAFLAAHALAEHFHHPIPPPIPTGGLFTAILFGLLAFYSFQYLRALDQYQPWDEDYGLRKW
jgi:Zn-dependent protease